MRLAFYIQYALRSLKRGGQRTLLGAVCVAFGVMSIVAMQVLASNVLAAVLTDPRADVGGDLQMGRPGQRLNQNDVSELDRLRANGVIQDYTLMADAGPSILQARGADGIFYLSLPLGVDPASFPLVGRVALREPRGMSLAEAIHKIGDVAITRDIADQSVLKVGDQVTLVSQRGDKRVTVRVSAIIDRMPDHRGDTMLYNLDTARAIAGMPDAVTRVALTFMPGVDIAAMRRQFTDRGWQLYTPEDVLEDLNRQRVADIFSFMLRGSGILGLIIGGIGVAGALRVLMSRRTLEIAMLKTLGYRQRDLILLFAIETGLLGAAGSLLGIALALGASQLLTGLLARTGNSLLEWSIDPVILAGGMVLGIATAVIFGLEPIVSSSMARPVLILRHTLPDATRRTRLQSGSLYLVLGILFAILCGITMQSMLAGLGVIAVAIIGLAALGLILGLALSILVQTPMPSAGLLNLARNHLKRQKVRAVISMVALFAGTFTIGFAAVTVYSANQRIAQRDLPDSADLTLYARRADEPAVRAEFQRQGIELKGSTYLLPVQARLGGASVAGLHVIEGVTEQNLHRLFDVRLRQTAGATWTDVGVLAPDSLESTLEALSSIELMAGNGQRHSAAIVGFYRPAGADQPADASYGLLASPDFVLDLGGDATAATLSASAPAGQLAQVTQALRTALPDVVVLSHLDQEMWWNRNLLNLFLFVVAVAGLALVAGAVLIANAVGLSMVERRREIGILKAVGHSARHVLAATLFEHAMVGGLGGLAGMGGVAVAVVLINGVQPDAQLILEPALVAAMTLVSMGIAMATAVLVARGPAQARPLLVLREE